LVLGSGVKEPKTENERPKTKNHYSYRNAINGSTFVARRAGR